MSQSTSEWGTASEWAGRMVKDLTMLFDLWKAQGWSSVEMAQGMTEVITRSIEQIKAEIGT